MGRPVVNEAGIELIKSFEGCYLKVYLDPVGIPTVGYGHVTSMAVGTAISQDQADELLRDDLVSTAKGVEHLVQVDLTDNQFSALVSFAFNVGLGALKGSHLLSYLNSGDYQAAADQFRRWDRAGGKVFPGLLRRREAERALFLS